MQLSETLNDGRMASAPAVQPREEKKVKKGFFGRKGEDEKGGEEGLGGQVGVKAGLEEICLRTTNEFGLYDTLGRLCVVVRVDAR